MNLNADYSQSGQVGHSNSQSEGLAQSLKVEDHRSTQRKFKDTLIRNLENISHGYTPGNFTAAKVESYLTHLGDSGSSQSTETCPLPNLTSDPFKSHAGEVYVPMATSYNYGISADSVNPQLQTETCFNEPRSKILSQEDIESIKLEIISTLKSELRETARDVAYELVNPSPATNLVPDLYSELYQTHLYTQL